MVSAVKSRPTYYEMLGVNPRASGNAVAEAFARATNVLQPHVFGSMAELCIAYQTLRDPIRRRAYDASIGLEPEPPRMPAPRSISAHFMAQPAVSGLASQPFVESEPAMEPKLTDEKPSTGPVEPAIERRPVPLDSPPAFQPSYDETTVGFGSTKWKRVGAVAGGLVAAAILIGALAGWWSGSAATEPEQPQRAAMTVPPPEKDAPSFAEMWAAPSPRAVQARPAQPRRAAALRASIKRAPERPQQLTEEPQPTQPAQAWVDRPADPLTPEAAPAPAIASSMPLPHRTVARTIDRIGYSCGSVASATQVEGTAGAYKVTCTSGQSFQAKPVNGRYRFRRLAGN